MSTKQGTHVLVGLFDYGRPVRLRTMAWTSVGSDRLTRLRRRGLLGDDADLVVQHLHEAAAHSETATGGPTQSQLTLTEQRHQRRVTGEDSNLTVVRGGYYGIRLALEQHGLR